MRILRKRRSPSTVGDETPVPAARGWGRFGPVLVLLLFAPISAEYLIGYDVLAGDPLAMLFGLMVFAPLYGAPALLIRELVRRTGGGWPSILLLGAAFGLVQAGLIDQGLFNPAYRDIFYWDALRQPTFLAPLGTSGFMLFHFTALHAFGSVYAPVAVAEALAGRNRDRPWLRPLGLTATTVVWLLAGWYVLADHLRLEGWQPSAWQVAGTVAAVGALVWAALRTARPSPVSGRTPAPSPFVVLVVSLGLLAARPLLAALSPAGPGWNSWGPTLFAVAAVVLWSYLMLRWSRAPGWSGTHVLASAAGYLFAVGGAAFLVTPLGDVDPAAKAAGNIALLVLVAVLVAAGWMVQNRREVPE
ncbi:hypothetical protein [Allonocardiopsis opalescens]|uniref:Uncharacterized protein n=1 Tax=Allonocardiopsis opalescens TaxID=1144618 RepID=A0A2T0PYU8_9ACTN|nr:hypothetical protein [Allonocardiopsis opalescens]PRX96577.1 hypothetical protein CLV72_107100 [Allonocardiopsis opalescens]